MKPSETEKTGGVTFESVVDGPRLEEVRTLFSEYARSLPFDLDFQDFNAELGALPGKYAEPEGVLLLARAGWESVGCIALHPLSDGVCEMKRLYVRARFRGLGLGRRLVLRVLDEARLRGYRAARLDTLPSMAEALRLYEGLGFHDTEPYVYNPFPDARYLELEL